MGSCETCGKSGVPLHSRIDEILLKVFDGKVDGRRGVDDISERHFRIRESLIESTVDSNVRDISERERVFPFGV